MTCIFCQIASGELPTDLLYFDEHVVAFRDIRPQAPSHVLVVPRAHIASLWELKDREVAGAMLFAAAEVGRLEGLEAGYRVITNIRDHGGQEVPHLHLHVVGGHPLGPMLQQN
ncbi:MAG: histidine triad (HIT) family protein [Planctomycetota bacterium]|jgi:histidine triad (HIT) family protein